MGARGGTVEELKKSSPGYESKKNKETGQRDRPTVRRVRKKKGPFQKPGNTMKKKQGNADVSGPRPAQKRGRRQKKKKHATKKNAIKGHGLVLLRQGRSRTEKDE